MTALAESKLPQSQASAAVVESTAAMAAIFEPGCNVVVLRRPLGTDLRMQAQAVLGDPLRAKNHISAVNAAQCLPAQLAAQFPHAPLLADDIAYWAELLAEVTGAPTIGVRLARLESAMCPRFHTHRVTMRLVCTYVGNGSEYLLNDDVYRPLLGKPLTAGADELHTGLLREGAIVQRAYEGDVVLLKGELWPHEEHTAAVHRSPSASAAHPRLVLTLDPLA